MRTLILIFLLAISLTSIGQQKRFMIQAKVIDPKGDPISDVYIVNLVSNEKDISHSDGVFTIRVLPSDSIVLSHISYFRKIINIHDILLDPIVTLYSENVDIPEVKVTPDQQSYYEHAMENLKFIETYNYVVKNRIQEEQLEPTQTIMTEYNDLMRSEASSVSLIRLSPSEGVENLVEKLKKKDSSTDYSSTRKQMKDIEKKDEIP